MAQAFDSSEKKRISAEMNFARFGYCCVACSKAAKTLSLPAAA
jgi:hypothetical protein